MVIAEIVLLIVWQIVPVVAGPLVPQCILPPDVEQEQHSTGDAEPDQAKSKSKTKRVFWGLTLEEHVASDVSAAELK
jgi:hypothetical protein